MALNVTIRTIQDIMRKDPGIDGDAQRIGQLSWLVFLKILDDLEREYEARETNYYTAIPSRLKWCNWATNKSDFGENGLIHFVDNELLPRLKNLPIDKDDGRTTLIREVLKDIYNYSKSDSLMYQTINRINEINFSKYIDRHVFGDIYEQILKGLQSAGNAGEYYTPRALTQFMTDMIDPQKGESVLDPACGTGGFLIAALNHMRQSDANDSDDEEVFHKTLTGVEKKPLPYLLCITNVMLHGLRVPSRIQRGNMLRQALESYDKQGQTDVILTNPPFGGMEEHDIKANFPKELRSPETAELFLLLATQLLKTGGRAAFVLPNGGLRGNGVKTRIKRKLLEECNVHTIIRLPQGVFNPYTGIATNLIFFTKGERTKYVWFYEHPYPPNTKSYNKTHPIQLEEFAPEKAWWLAREQNEHAWKVCIEDIEKNDYNLDIRNPYTEVKVISNPELLSAQYSSLAKDILRDGKKLRIMLLERQDETVVKPIVENLDLFFQDVGNLEDLKELIFQFTMLGEMGHGKKEDKPVKQLLESLVIEREKLAKTQAKGGNGLVDIDSVTHPYRLPDHWVWVRLGDLGTIASGGTPKTDHAEYFAKNGIPWITPADCYGLRHKLISRGKRDISSLGLSKSSARLLPAGTVLFSSRAPIGYVAIAANPLATNQGFKSCIPFIPAMSEYIFI